MSNTTGIPERIVLPGGCGDRAQSDADSVLAAIPELAAATASELAAEYARRLDPSRPPCELAAQAAALAAVAARLPRPRRG